jgi:hypothetical protein
MQTLLASNINSTNNLRNDMGRCDKIDIVTTFCLQFEHDRCNSFIIHFDSSSLVTDFEILAKSTEQVAMSEKDGAGTICADQAAFFSKMGIVT